MTTPSSTPSPQAPSKIAVVGLGYVGMSMAVLLARQNQVPRSTLVDLLRGQNKGRYGQAHRGAIVLGLKPEPATSH